MPDSKRYIPISCTFYDYLEEAATLQKPAVIEFSSNGKVQVVESRVVDLFIVDKAEYMRLANGLELRLDQLLQVNGIVLPKPNRI